MQAVTAVIVGAGHRALAYAEYARQRPEELRIVGVADPDPHRRELVARRFDLPPDRCFKGADDLAATPRFADAVINGTMDHQHVPTSLPLIRAGYHILLEKPFATTEDELWRIVEATATHERIVTICHVLRYTPFYATIRDLIERDAIGEIVNLQTTEHVSYHHVAVSFVRGKYGNYASCRSSMLMAKCCHDLDLLTWFKPHARPRAVSSFGSRIQFRPERAPEGAGTRCLVDCPPEVEAACLYSARKHYIDHPDRWSFYVWSMLEGEGDVTIERKIESLRTDNPYGRCVYRCDNDVVDHQSLVVEFTDGSTATHNMIGGAAKGSRGVHLIGTRGEIEGRFEDSRIIVRRIDPSPGGPDYTEEVIDLEARGDMHGAFGGHGGGDLRLVADFVRVVRGEGRSLSSSTLEDSIDGHLLGFAADRAREEGRVVQLADRPRGGFTPGRSPRGGVGTGGAAAAGADV